MGSPHLLNHCHALGVGFIQGGFRMVTVFKFILVTVLLLSMVLVLVLIKFIANPKEAPSRNDRDRLRHDVETRERVITSNSLFHDFFARPSHHSSKQASKNL